MVEIQHFLQQMEPQVDALDYSSVAIDILNKLAEEKRLPIKLQTFDIKNPLPFADGYFDAAYSHMLFNMRFSEEELNFAFSEISRVLKSEGLNFFSVRKKEKNLMVKALKLMKESTILMAFKFGSLQKSK